MLSAVAAALFLPLYLGSMPFPVSAAISGIVNLALVWAGLQWTSSLGMAALPLWAWLATVIGLTLGGPGDDVVFGGAGIMQAGPLVLVALGAAPPLVLVWRRMQAA